MRGQIALVMIAGAIVAVAAGCGSAAPAAAPKAAPTAAAVPATAAPATAAPAAAAAAKPAATSAPAAAAPASSAEWDKIVAAAKQEGKVVMYGTLLSTDDSTKLGAAFKKDTGIELDFMNMLGGQATTRIKEEVKVNKAPDVFEGSGGWVGTLPANEFYVPLKGKPLPVWSEPNSVWYMHPGYKTDDWSSVLSRLRPKNGHIAINTKLLQPADYPKNWDDLATNPKYSGQMAWSDPATTTGTSVLWEMHGYVAKTMSLKDLYGIVTGQKTLLIQQNRGMFVSVAQGEREITPQAVDESVLDLINAGAPIRDFYFPDLYRYSQTADMAVLKAAQHPNAALVFINWYLSKAGQEAITQIQQVASLRKDVPDGVPDVLKGTVIGGGKLGPMIVETPMQNQFGSDLQKSGVLKKLTDGSSFDDFQNAYNTWLKGWESKNGGPQDKPMTFDR